MHLVSLYWILNANKLGTSKWGKSKIVGLDFHLDFNNCIHISIFPHAFKQDFNLTFLLFEFIEKLSIFSNPNSPIPWSMLFTSFPIHLQKKGCIIIMVLTQVALGCLDINFMSLIFHVLTIPILRSCKTLLSTTQFKKIIEK